MKYSEADYLQLSGLQHFAFCRRQWALIHIEQLWQENARTVQGELLHERAHDASYRERRGDVLIIRGLRVASSELGVSGACDIVEFYKDPEGAFISGEDGRWRPYPIEYKRGREKSGSEDLLQLCAQALCLEEMLCCSVPCGALYYGEIRHRKEIHFDETLKTDAKNLINEMHEYYRRGYTPKVKTGKHCNACSMKALCLPVLCRNLSVEDYIAKHLLEDSI